MSQISQINSETSPMIYGDAKYFYIDSEVQLRFSINQHNEVTNSLPFNETSSTMPTMRPIFVLHSMTVV